MLALVLFQQAIMYHLVYFQYWYWYKLYWHHFFYDIQPENEEISQLDYLNFNKDIVKHKIKENTNIHIIGNPPFGRGGSNAIKFINKAAEFADTIAFILPRSFRKESRQRRVDKNFWLIKDIDLFEESCFIFEDED